MNEQDKQLLIQDLCARLPHNVTVLKRKPFGCVLSEEEKILEPEDIRDFIENEEVFIFPYLRPMSSMTDEECEIMRDCFTYCVDELDEFIASGKAVDFLNSHHFDYRGLIEKGLAINDTKRISAMSNKNE